MFLKGMSHIKKINIVILVTIISIFVAVSSAWSVEVQMPKMNPPVTTLPEYPIIDGSSSTVTMHSAIRAYLTDVYLRATHTDTYVYYRQPHKNRIRSIFFNTCLRS